MKVKSNIHLQLICIGISLKLWPVETSCDTSYNLGFLPLVTVYTECKLFFSQILLMLNQREINDFELEPEPSPRQQEGYVVYSFQNLMLWETYLMPNQEVFFILQCKLITELMMCTYAN